MEKELGKPQDLQKVKKVLEKNLFAMFGMSL